MKISETILQLATNGAWRHGQPFGVIHYEAGKEPFGFAWGHAELPFWQTDDIGIDYWSRGDYWWIVYPDGTVTPVGMDYQPLTAVASIDESEVHGLRGQIINDRREIRRMLGF